MRTFMMVFWAICLAVSVRASLIFDGQARLLYAYGTWDKHVQVHDGVVSLRGDGMTTKGGAGFSATADLSKVAVQSPALSVRVGAANRMKVLRLLLCDEADRKAIYLFTLPAAGTGFTVVTPQDGAPLSKPNGTDDTGMPDLAKIGSWQLSGDWQGDGPLDIEVNRVETIPPNDAILAQRAELQKKEAKELAQRLQEQQALRAQYGKRTALSPVVETVSMVAPDTIALTIRAGKVIPGKLEPYAAMPGDEKRANNNPDGSVRQLILVRGGKEIGWLIGAKRDQLVRYEGFEGDPLLDDVTESPTTYTIHCAADPNYRQDTHPTAVYRKSKPTDWAMPINQFPMQHIIYLKVAKPLQAGCAYALNLGDVNVSNPDIVFKFAPDKVRSEAVHINQIGYRADDPVKRAFVSVWLGTGGVCRYAPNSAFHIVDDVTGSTVFTGKVELAKDAADKEPMFRDANFNMTSVYRMDFSALRRAGKYRVVLDGVGCSYPFEIGAKVWERAFITQMMGLYNERSGTALGPPYSTFVKPRDFNPADGAQVFQSTYSVLDGGGEYEVAKHPTSTPVLQAWGGYHDAGDWNPRRATHLRVTMAQLEVMELYPAYFGKLRWNLPGDQKMPPILREAQFELDLFRRLQQPDGGVGYGIETDGDPIDGEVSWLTTMPAYVHKPDLWSSFIYASTAARFSKLATPYDPALAKLYRASALKAMQWAEQEYDKLRAAGGVKSLRWEAKDDRNLAEVVMYDVTGDAHWHDLFKASSCLSESAPNLFAYGDHVQIDAAFAYARIDAKRTDAEMRRRAVDGIETLAKRALAYAAGNAYNITTLDKYRPMFMGFYSMPNAVELARAHYLTAKPEYLAGVVQACQFAAGCNPNNITYTSGVGANPVKHPLHLDSRRTGQPAPIGLTVYGNYDFVGWNQQWAIWPLQYHLSRLCKPNVWTWPMTEAYFDIFLFVSENEFTVDAWAPNVYVWGYLAGRPAK